MDPHLERDDRDACVEWLKARMYPDGSACPKCGKVTKFHRIASRAAYSCQYCRHQVYPTAGTIFHKSSTSSADVVLGDLANGLDALRHVGEAAGARLDRVSSRVAVAG